MKVRSGFISNSSSSMFLVCISDDIHTKDDFISLARARRKLNKPIEDWDSYSEKPVTNRECLERLWEDLMRMNCMADRAFWDEEARYGAHIEGSMTWPYSYCDETTPCNVFGGIDEEKMIEMEKMAEKWNKIVANKIVEEVFEEPGSTLYQIRYNDGGDEQGITSACMEHGSFWQYVHYVKVSEH